MTNIKTKLGTLIRNRKFKKTILYSYIAITVALALFVTGALIWYQAVDRGWRKGWNQGWERAIHDAKLVGAQTNYEIEFGTEVHAYSVDD